MKRLVFCIAMVWCLGCEPPKNVLRLAVTTSTRDSGLLDELIPPFEAENDVRVELIAVGTGAALKLGEAGDVDAILVHDHEAEMAFMDAHHGVMHEKVMYNWFMILGPEDDPAGIQGLAPAAAIKQIAAAKARFVTRGDNSGTHKREMKLWDAVGGIQTWDDLVTTGTGMGKSLVVASELQAYVLTDSATFLKMESKLQLVPLVTSAATLKNPYGVIAVNSDKHADINGTMAFSFVDYLKRVETQQLIRDYRVNGQPLFYPLQLREMN